MIRINIKDLIYTMPDLINLFLSGFIFIVMYNWLNHKEMNISLITIWSLFISILVKSTCTILHTFIFVNVEFSDSAKIIVYSFIGLSLAMAITWLRNTKLLRIFLYKVNNKSINDNIFDDVIDYDKRTNMMVYLKNTPLLYVGRFLYREEKGIDSYICLIDYACLSTKDGQVIFDPDKSDMLSTVVINLKDVERIQLQYEKDSAVWKRFCIDARNDNKEKETVKNK